VCVSRVGGEEDMKMYTVTGTPRIQYYIGVRANVCVMAYVIMLFPQFLSPSSHIPKAKITQCGVIRNRGNREERE